MDLSKTVYAIIGVLVAVLVVATVAVPVVEDSTKVIDTRVENSNYRYMMVDDDMDDRIVVSSTDPSSGVFTINGTPVTFLSDDEWGNFYLIATDTLFLRLYSDGVYATYEGKHWHYNISNGFEIVFENGTWTLTRPDVDPLTRTYEWLFYPSSDGSYGLFRSSEVWVDRDAMVVAWKESATSSEGVITMPTMSVWGSIDDGLVHSAWIEESDEYVDVSADTTTYFDIIESGDKADKITICASYGSNSQAIATIIAPIEYHVITASDAGLINLLYIVPAFLFLVPIMMIVRMIAGRSD